jgi:Fic family protein
MQNTRQQAIVDYLKHEDSAATSGQIIEYLAKAIPVKNSRITIIRDLDALLKSGKITKSGKGRATKYAAAIDIEEYFNIDPDKRTLKSEYFNFAVWDVMDNLFSKMELARMDRINEQYRKNKAALSPGSLKKELERLTIEFAWKSSKIEGNTYTLLDTERLIKEQVEAEGKKHEEATMILNHKKALDFVFSNHGYFKKTTLHKIEDIHRLLTKGLEISRGIRQNRVGITGTNYRPLDNSFQIKEAMERLAQLLNHLKHPVAKALTAVLMISYIQPFEDGNKRTARLLGNALLLAHSYCPLSYRSVDEIEYKKGIVLFYEQNDFTYFKHLFVEQFEQAVNKYF